MRLKFVFAKPSTKYFQTIDTLPLRNWIKIHDGDYRYMRKDLTIGLDKYDLEYYHIMYNGYIKEMGLNKVYKKTLNLMRKIAILQCDYVISGDRVKLTKSEIEMEKLKSILATNNNKEGMTIQQSLVHLSKWIGSFLDLDKLTTRQYLDLLKGVEHQNAKMNELKTQKTQKKNG